MTGLILPHFSDALGLPKKMIYGLAVFPAIYMLFSLSCYRFSKEVKSWMLLTIILANLLYCLLTASILGFYDGLSTLAKYLLAAEIMLLIGVVALEWTVYRAGKHEKEEKFNRP